MALGEFLRWHVVPTFGARKQRQPHRRVWGLSQNSSMQISSLTLLLLVVFAYCMVNPSSKTLLITERPVVKRIWDYRSDVVINFKRTIYVE